MSRASAALVALLVAIAGLPPVVVPDAHATAPSTLAPVGSAPASIDPDTTRATIDPRCVKLLLPAIKPAQPPTVAKASKRSSNPVTRKTINQGLHDYYETHQSGAAFATQPTWLYGMGYNSPTANPFSTDLGTGLRSPAPGGFGDDGVDGTAFSLFGSGSIDEVGGLLRSGASGALEASFSSVGPLPGPEVLGSDVRFAAGPVGDAPGPGASPAVAQVGTPIATPLESLGTYGLDGAPKTEFSPGDPVSYVARIGNVTSAAAEVRGSFVAFGAGPIMQAQGSLSVPPGGDLIYVNTRIPADAVGGAYVVRGRVSFGGRTSELVFWFLVRGASNPIAVADVATFLPGFTPSDPRRFPKASFRPGDFIQYQALVTNASGVPQLATLTFGLDGPGAFDPALPPQTVLVPPGGEIFYFTEQIPATVSVPLGAYTFRARASFNGQTSEQTSAFSVIGALNPAAVVDVGTFDLGGALQRVFVQGDTIDEPDETFGLTLTNPTNATIATGTGTILATIVDDDAAAVAPPPDPAPPSPPGNTSPPGTTPPPTTTTPPTNTTHPLSRRLTARPHRPTRVPRRTPARRRARRPRSARPRRQTRPHRLTRAPRRSRSASAPRRARRRSARARRHRWSSGCRPVSLPPSSTFPASRRWPVVPGRPPWLGV